MDAPGNPLLQANGAKCAASEPSITGGLGLVIGRHGDRSAAFKATHWPERGWGRAIQRRAPSIRIRQMWIDRAPL